MQKKFRVERFPVWAFEDAKSVIVATIARIGRGEDYHLSKKKN